MVNLRWKQWHAGGVQQIKKRENRIERRQVGAPFGRGKILLGVEHVAAASLAQPHALGFRLQRAPCRGLAAHLG